MRQFILPEPGDPDSPVILDKKDTHYLKNVLRCKPGRVFSVMDRSGRSWKAVIERFEGASAVIRLAGEGPAGEGTEATTAADAADAESTAGCTTGRASGNTEGIDKAGYSGSAPKDFPGDAPGKKVKLPEDKAFSVSSEREKDGPCHKAGYRGRCFCCNSGTEQIQYCKA